MTTAKYIIAGAGLSGLTTAYYLLKQGEKDFIILEGRDRIGGRITTHDGIDLGATWFQTHHTHLLALVEELKVKKFRQYSIGKGIFIYSSMAPPQYFDNGGNETAAFRIGCGSMALIEALAKPLQGKIRLNTTITKIAQHETAISVQTTSGSFSANIFLCRNLHHTWRIHGRGSN